MNSLKNTLKKMKMKNKKLGIGKTKKEIDR